MYISYTHSLLIQTSPCYWSGCLIQVALLCQDTSQPSSLLVTNLLQTEYLPFLLCVFKSNRNFPGKKSSLQKTDCCVKFVKFVLFGTWFQINSIFTGNDVWTLHMSCCISYTQTQSYSSVFAILRQEFQSWTRTAVLS